MASILTSWKEIANYLRKGVRTVQRWEQELGLPVRRPEARGKGVVLAFPDELDAWLRNQPTANGDHLHRLQETIVTLTSENAALRAELQSVLAGGGALPVTDGAKRLHPAATLSRSRRCVPRGLDRIESIDAAEAVRASVRQRRDELRVVSEEAVRRSKAS